MMPSVCGPSRATPSLKISWRAPRTRQAGVLRLLSSRAAADATSPQTSRITNLSSTPPSAVAGLVMRSLATAALALAKTSLLTRRTLPVRVSGRIFCKDAHTDSPPCSRSLDYRVHPCLPASWQLSLALRPLTFNFLSLALLLIRSSAFDIGSFRSDIQVYIFLLFSMRRLSL